MVRHRLNRQGIKCILEFSSKSQSLSNSYLFLKTSMISSRTLRVLGCSLKDILIYNDSPDSFEFENTQVPIAIGLPLLRLAKPIVMSINYTSDETTAHLLEICENVVHLQLAGSIDATLINRMKPHLESMEVSSEALYSVVPGDGLKLDNLVINCYETEHPEITVKGLIQIQAKSTELFNTEVSQKELVTAMIRNKQLGHPYVNHELRSLKYIVYNCWPEEMDLFFNVFHETFPGLTDFEFELMHDVDFITGDTIYFTETLEQLTEIIDGLNKKLEEWDMTFKLVGTVFFEVSDKKKAREDFEESIKNLEGPTVIKNKKNEDKITVTLSTSKLNFCFNASFIAK